MSILNLRKEKKSTLDVEPAKRIKKELEKDMYTKCPNCHTTEKTKAIEKNMNVCPSCDHHFRIGVNERVMFNVGKITPLFENLDTVNPLGFNGYEQKIKDYKASSGQTEAVNVGTTKYGKTECVVAIMNPQFMMGSMGSVVGERITMAFEHATKNKMPIIIFTASGGARMQEGLFSLMQMAKTSAAAKKHSDAGLLFINVITNPTTGGVSASFAMLGDIHIAEPGALIGFAGPRVIKQTTRQQLPKGFQKAETVLEHGFVDMIVPRQKIKKTLEKLISIHTDRR